MILLIAAKNDWSALAGDSITSVAAAVIATLRGTATTTAIDAGRPVAIMPARQSHNKKEQAND